MRAPNGFTWIDRPRLAAMAEPTSQEEYQWLREQGIQYVISLAETPPRRVWVNEAGLFSLHVPIEDMQPPTQEQIDQVLEGIEKGIANQLGVGIHCTAGLGRTGTILACWLARQENIPARDAIARVRQMRPGSIETAEQEDAVSEFTRRRRGAMD